MLLGAGSLLAGLLVASWLGPGADLSFQLSMASGYVGLVLLASTLLTGPVNVLRRRPNPVSTNLRRDLGIWAGIVAVFHVVIGLQRHLPGQMLSYFVWPDDRHPVPLRYDLFGLANWTGLWATAVIGVLLVFSNDLSLRRLGTRLWKAIQRWNYAAFVTVAAHTALYQLVEDRTSSWVAAGILLILVVTAAQLAGYARHRAAAIERST